MIRVQGYVQYYDPVCLNGDLSTYECPYSMWRILPLIWILNLFQDSKIRFDLKSNLTSAINDFSKSRHLASYVSRYNAMAYDTHRMVCEGFSFAHHLNFFNLHFCSVKLCFCCADTQIHIQNDHFLSARADKSICGADKSLSRCKKLGPLQIRIR